MWQFQVVQTLDEFGALAGDWNRLLAESASHVPFLRHEYLFTWWQTLGGGEWPSGELSIVLARDETGELRGIAPLFLTQNREGQAALMLLGSIEISDYLDFIVRQPDLLSFCRGLLQFLGGLASPAWQVIDLYNVLDSSPTLPALEAAAQQLGWRYRAEPLQHSPYIPLPGDWEAYLAGISKKQRHEIRRKLRRLEESGLSFRWYIVQEEQHLDREIGDFIELMAMDSEKQAFLTAVMRSQMRSAVWAAFRAGWLQLAFLEIEGEKAAGYLNFDYGNQIWVYNSGMNPRFNAYSPGWVLLSYLIKWANEHGRTAFDFMRGNEEYKYRFGAIDRFVMRLCLER
ncbi:MAG: GNAT family N-acetyltransferase [Anaerolineales bacterium]|nr:GNAT family N-acetyltransferase [Anaerolineales bacterium]MCS7247959.1 GNAT family N-acetyltransferase [Anaerolineales bacterium]MDW8161770.1 GNAT family N-acetyltransferase [Anaerolineales bacterium]MDW8448065.1 GNAT family N-acetyltransferase [Anaerolineales bacterium]